MKFSFESINMKIVFAIAALVSLCNAAVLTVSPGESIQAAIELAQPGDTVELKDGEYIEDLVTVRDGEPDKHIAISGGLFSRLTRSRLHRNSRSKSTKDSSEDS